MINPFIVGENIYLRPLCEADAEKDYVSWFNDAEVCQFNSHYVFPYHKQSAQKYIQSTFGSLSTIVLAICMKDNDFHIGNVSLQEIDLHNRVAEFAIIMGNKDYWRKGYSKEAALLILKHGFMELNLHRIGCGTSIENIGMQKLAKVMGMKEEGRRKEALFKHGHYVDIIEYGLVETDYYTKFERDGKVKHEE